MKILESHEKHNIKAAIFDFDGTLSTLRCGWEDVMAPMFEEYLNKTPNVKELVADFIDASTGIQTVMQMQWLKDQVIKQGDEPMDIWDYKAEYNRRLMKSVEIKKELAKEKKENYLIKNCENFLKALKDKGIKLYAASGTDDADVLKESAVLGLNKYFDQIKGAMPFSTDCSKEATLKSLMENYKGEDLLVVGDGPVEIRLGREAGALTLGICANEKNLSGFDQAKVRRLTNAKAHVLIDSFDDIDCILNWMEE